ncbi:ArsR/SmtB family transcription factor [Kitasatospora sp. NPDC056327]|uniref:ArsR/SmtB family transcription factor n=1 Tax=Kitasatospora sp. NPDC056327 TaxID=3345785 RepID=UPI0035DD695A
MAENIENAEQAERAERAERAEQVGQVGSAGKAGGSGGTDRPGSAEGVGVADEGRAGPAPLKERRVEDAATLKALADPLRLAILDVLMAALATGALTAKEIAAALDEPQTKLYRHLKQLEKAGLVRVAGTRLVSGIVESRYAPAQASLRLAPEIFAPGSPARIDAYDAMLAAMDRVRGDFRAHVMADRIDFAAAPDDAEAGPPGMFSHFTYRLAPERLRRLRRQLAEIFEELAAEGESGAEDAVEATLFTLLYGVSPEPVVDSRTGTRPGTES